MASLKITALFWGEDFNPASHVSCLFHMSLGPTFTNFPGASHRMNCMESMEDHPTNLSRDPARRLHGIFRRIDIYIMVNHPKIARKSIPIAFNLHVFQSYWPYSDFIVLNSISLIFFCIPQTSWLSQQSLVFPCQTPSLPVKMSFFTQFMIQLDLGLSRS